MGFQDHMVVKKVADGMAIICVIMGTRMALGRELCEHIEVERLAA
jgi:Fe2+ transport system protein FeoA